MSKPVRCVVTGHDQDGRAIITADSLLDGRLNPTGVSRSTVVWTTVGCPIEIDAAEDGRDQARGLTHPGGSVLRFVDMLPGGASPMHRTSSLDYGILLSGQVELLLDDGGVTTIEPGDVVIQRGTIHAWRNPSPDTVARIAFVLLDATPASVNGEVLPDIAPGPTARS